MKAKAKNNFKKLTSLYKSPETYLANYFINLKNEIDLIFNQTETNELNNIIQKFENECLSNKDKIHETINDIILKIEQTIEIDHIQARFEEAYIDSDYKQINELINLKIFETEKYLFSNKTILLLKNYTEESKTFLMVINNEYLDINLNVIK